MTRDSLETSPETCPLTCQDIGLHGSYLPSSCLEHREATLFTVLGMSCSGAECHFGPGLSPCPGRAPWDRAEMGLQLLGL